MDSIPTQLAEAGLITDPAVIDADVVIVGGGLAGLTLACALATAGLPVVCVDRDDPSVQLLENFDGRTTAISLGSQRVLDGAGIWPRIDPDAQPILDIRVTDQNDPLFLHYAHQEVGDLPFGWIVENRTIRQAQFARVRELPSLTHLTATSARSIERTDTHALVTLEDGRVVRARLVIGADGRNSLVRSHANIRVDGWSYPQHAIAVTIEHEEPHYGTAVELFLPAGPFAMLPLTGNRTSIVWSEREALAPFYMNLDEARFTAELQRRCGDWLGRVTPVGKRFCYPLGISHAERYTDRRLALVSETIHTMHPIAGQGLNMGLRDVAALAEAIVDAWRLGLDVGASDVLERYQRWRRFDNFTLLAVTDALTRLFSNDIGPVAVARRLGLAAVDRLPPLRPLKRLFMRHAMGVVGELPRMIKGEPL
ncbi:MAG TPA: UbiH/UbiF/VisC/COQ6 family ubiquinone biosynthesis hydroxylase [Azospirillaceae bacterium]|nr:UbiH/UbiF/VisC/COQ6 family ubiquinone biosynthesis hydroxylase [Azospirillaceae bacterium]